MARFNAIQRAALSENGEGSRRFRAIVSTPSIDRAGDVIEVGGISLKNYMNNPVILLQHRAEWPVGKCLSLTLEGNKLIAEGEFAPAGVSPEADKTYGLLRAGILNAVSIGLIPTKAEPMDPKEPWGSYRYIESDMLEFSIVALPMNAEALILERALGGSEIPPANLEDFKRMESLLKTVEAMDKAPSLPPPPPETPPPTSTEVKGETEAGKEAAQGETSSEEKDKQPPCVDDVQKSKDVATRKRLVDVLRRRIF